MLSASADNISAWLIVSLSFVAACRLINIPHTSPLVGVSGNRMLPINSNLAGLGWSCHFMNESSKDPSVKKEKQTPNDLETSSLRNLLSARLVERVDFNRSFCVNKNREKCE